MIIRSAKIKSCVNWLGDNINSPEQRLLLGATALATQPLIDFKNKNIDDNTRAISVARTLAKIIAGTLVGVAVRHYSIATVQKYSKVILTKNEKGLITGIKKESKSDIFTPLFSKFKNCTEEQFQKDYKLYTKAMGTLLATFAMIFTNFAIDAPLTRFLTRTFHTYITKNKLLEKKEDK